MASVNFNVEQGKRRLKLVIDSSDVVKIPRFRLVDVATGEVILGVSRVSLNSSSTARMGESVGAMVAHVELWIDDIEVIPASMG